MDFFAHNYQIGTILNKKVYKIPEFQREYSWEKEELESFWEDVYLKREEGSNFFGSIVLVGKNFNDERGPFDVIDGQQRLTTFFILLNRIINRLEIIEEENLAMALKERLIFKDDNAKEYLALENENAHSFFQKILFYNKEDELGSDREIIEAKNLLFAKEFFQEKVKEFDRDSLIKLRDTILKINIIVVVQESAEVAFEIFETLNFRGMDLSVLDLVKNFIVRKYPKDTGIDDPRETWKDIIQNIKGDKKNFFNRYWSGRFKKVSDPKIFKEFREKTKNFTPEEAKILLLDLKDFSKAYRDVISPSDSSWITYCPSDKKDRINLQLSVESLTRFQVKVHYPLIINAIELCREKKINQKQLLELINLLEKFHFIFNAICSRRPSGMDQRYSKYAINIKDNPTKFDETINNLKLELKDKKPGKEDFNQNFIKLDFEKDKNLILYSFRTLEKKYQPGTIVDISEESIDHLSTQSAKEEWCHNIGNLILLEKDLNQERDNRLLSESLDIIKRTSYKTTKEFLKTDIIPWGLEKVNKKAELMGSELYEYIANNFI
jgi:uncharacterized protein with ParB-like and HNH nuclease domain